MPNLRFMISLLALALLLPAAPFGQERRQAGGPPPYDVRAETTARGTAGKMYPFESGPAGPMMILPVTVEGRTLQLILGPADFVEKQTVTIKDGVAVEVTGVPGFQLNGEPAMLTRQVKSGTATLTLRDAAGQPAWGR